MNKSQKFTTTFLVALAALAGLNACERQGPVERAGEEVDEAVDTLKNGGRESTANKLDDAGDEVREGAADAKDALKND